MSVTDHGGVRADYDFVESARDGHGFLAREAADVGYRGFAGMNSFIDSGYSNGVGDARAE
jgi:hypothetical protein